MAPTNPRPRHHNTPTPPHIVSRPCIQTPPARPIPTSWPRPSPGHYRPGPSRCVHLLVNSPSCSSRLYSTLPTEAAKTRCQLLSGNDVISCYPTSDTVIPQHEWASFVCAYSVHVRSFRVPDLHASPQGTHVAQSSPKPMRSIFIFFGPTRDNRFSTPVTSSTPLVPQVSTPRRSTIRGLALPGGIGVVKIPHFPFTG